MEVNLKEIKLPDHYEEFAKLIDFNTKTYLINYQGVWRTGWFENEIPMESNNESTKSRVWIPPIGGFQLNDEYNYISFKKRVNGMIYEIDSLFIDIKYSDRENLRPY